MDALVEGTIAGHEASWRRLWQTVEPRLLGVLRRPNLLGRLSESEDDVRNIVVEVMARLRADRNARLRSYVEARRQCPTLPFMAWLVVVAKHVAIDYMRAHETYVDRRHLKDASSPGAWRNVEPLPNESQLPAERPPFTARGTAREMLALAATHLTAVQRAALDGWLSGASFDEIAAGGDPAEAERVVRAALQRIRRSFPKAGAEVKARRR